MALMRKFEPGGSLDMDALNNQLNLEISKFKFKGKDEQRVREAVASLRDHISSSDDNIFTADRVSKKYTVSGEGSEKFNGSSDEIKTGFLSGRLKLKDDNDIMSVAASIYDNALTNIKSKNTSTVTNKPKEYQFTNTINTNDFDDYFVNDRYGSADNYNLERRNWKTDEDIQSKIIEGAEIYVDNILQRASNSPGSLSDEVLSNLQKTREVINTGDWNSFKDRAAIHKWNYGKLFLSPEELSSIEQERKQAEKKAKEEEATNLRNTTLADFKSKGISEQVAENLYNAGYTQFAPEGWKPNNDYTNFADMARQNDAFILFNPTNNRAVAIKNNELWNSQYSNRFGKRYGYSWTSNLENGLSIFKPGQNENIGEIDDQWADNIDGIGLNHNLGNNFKVYGYANDIDGDYSRDIFGRRDILFRLRIRDNEGNEFWATRNNQGKYIKDNGEILDINLNGFSGTNLREYDYSKIFDLINYKGEQEYNSNKNQEIYNKLANLRNSDGWFLEINDRYAKYARHLVWAATKDESIKNNPTLKKKYLDLATQYTKSVKKYIDQKSQKAQKGTKLQKLQNGSVFEEYAREQSRNNTQVKNNTPIRDITGTYKGMTGGEKALSIAETTLDVASMVPVLGGFAALGSTGAGLMKDLLDGNIDDWGKHAMNVGFTLAAFAGAGFAKNALKGAGLATKAAKATNALDTSLDMVKAAEKVKSTKTGAKDLKVLKKHFKDDKTITRESLNTLKNGNTRKRAEQAFDSLEKLSKTPTTTSEIVKSAIKSGYNYTLDKSKKVLPKAGLALQTGMVGYGLSGIPRTIAEARDADGNFSMSYMNADRLHRSLIGIAGTKSLSKSLLDRKAIKLIKGTTTKGTPTAQIKVENNTFDLEKPVLAKSKFRKRDSAKQEDLTKQAEKQFKANYKGENPDEAWKKIEDDVVKEIKGLNSGDFKVETTTKSLFTPGKIGGTTSFEQHLHLRANRILNDLKNEGYTINLPNNTKPSNVKPKPKNNTKSYNEKRIEEIDKNIKYISKRIEQLKNERYGPNSKNLTRQEKSDLTRNINKRNKALERNKKELEEITKLNKGKSKSNKKVTKKELGGLIQKLNTGNVIQSGNTTKKYKYNNNSTQYIPHNDLVLDGSDWRFGTDGKYTSDYTNMISGLNDDWWNKYKSHIQSLTGGTSVKINNLDAFKKLATDYKPGRIHEFTFNKDILDLSKLNDNLLGPIKIPDIKLSNDPQIPTTISNIPIVNPNGVKQEATGALLSTGTNNDGNQDLVNSPISWSLSRNTPEIITNLLSYNAIKRANALSANAQKRGLNESRYQIPYKKHTYLRTSTPYTLSAIEQAGMISSRAGTLADNIADIDKAMSIRLQGGRDAAEVLKKGRDADLAYNENIRNKQLELNVSTDEQNRQTLSQNRALNAEINRKLNLVDSNKALYDGTNKSNLYAAFNTWWKKVQDDRDKIDLLNHQFGPEYTNLLKDYQYHLKERENMREQAKSQWTADNPGKEYNENEYLSQQQVYKDWEARNKGYEEQMAEYKRKANMLQSFYSMGINPRYATQLPGYKKGGSLAPGEYLEAVRLQSETKRRTTDQTLFYKMIIHNNEMLRKSLIKIF